MTLSDTHSQVAHKAATRRAGFTIVEILIAMGLTLILMGTAVTLFGLMTDSVANNRAMIETSDRMRFAVHRLRVDLQGVTAVMNPPLDPEDDLGYFEVRDGAGLTLPGAWNPDTSSATDGTVGAMHDVIMFTSRSNDEPFIGRFGGSTRESYVAEIAWFLRGTNLHRRALLVLPATIPDVASQVNYYATRDISAHWDGSNMVANSLSDLTEPTKRFARLNTGGTYGIDHWGILNLPTLRETSSPSWSVGTYNGVNSSSAPSAGNIDYWNAPFTWLNGSGTPITPAIIDSQTGTLNGRDDGSRFAEDIILTNVINFNVQLWREGDSDYTNIDYNTWSTHFERDGQGNDYAFDGLDNNGSNGIDDIGEWDNPGPTSFRIRGVRIRIRVFEPDSAQIREVEVVQDFLN